MSENVFDDRELSAAMRQIRESESLAAAIPSLQEWSSRVAKVPALDRCPSCGGQPLRDVTSHRVRCGCGWTGMALRRLP